MIVPVAANAATEEATLAHLRVETVSVSTPRRFPRTQITLDAPAAAASPSPRFASPAATTAVATPPTVDFDRLTGARLRVASIESPAAPAAEGDRSTWLSTLLGDEKEAAKPSAEEAAARSFPRLTADAIPHPLVPDGVDPSTHTPSRDELFDFNPNSVAQTRFQATDIAEMEQSGTIGPMGLELCA